MPTVPVLWKPGRGLSALLRAVTSDWTAAPERIVNRTGAAPATAARSRPREWDGTGKG
jgi:hypothetical protein